MVRVSKHASRRLKERCGLNKKSVQRMADIAFTNGMKQEDATGQLNRWMRVYIVQIWMRIIYVFTEIMYTYFVELH